MKRLFFFFLQVSGILGFSVYPGSLVTVENFTYEVSEEGLTVSMELTFDPHALPARKGVFIYPCLQGENGIEFLPEVHLLGKKRYKEIKRETVLNKKNALQVYRTVNTGKEKDSSIEYHFTLPWKQWMAEAEFSVIQQTDRGRPGTEDYHTIFYLPLKIPVSGRAGSVEENRTDAAVIPFVVKGPEWVVKQLEGVVNMDFLPGKKHPVDYFSEHQDELLKIKEAINRVILDPEAVLKGIYLTGYSSIEGSFGENEQVAKDRVRVLKNYLSERYPEHSGKIIQDWKGEDWDMLRGLIEKSYMPCKDEVLEIIRNVGIFNGREKLLMDVAGGVPYRYMSERFFPLLRRVEYRIEYEKME